MSIKTRVQGFIQPPRRGGALPPRNKCTPPAGGPPTTPSGEDIGVASYGARAPLDFQLVILREQEQILRIQIRKIYKNNAIFALFLSIVGPFFIIFLPKVFLRE